MRLSAGEEPRDVAWLSNGVVTNGTLTGGKVRLPALTTPQWIAVRCLIDTGRLVDVDTWLPNATRIIVDLHPASLYGSIISHRELFKGVFGFPDTDDRIDELYALLDRYETLLLSDPIMEIFGALDRICAAMGDSFLISTCSSGPLLLLTTSHS